MRFKVIGKRRFSGVSRKTGKEYDFVNLYYLEEIDSSVGCGKCGESLLLDPKMHDYSALPIDCLYDVQFDNHGRVISLNVIKA